MFDQWLKLGERIIETGYRVALPAKYRQIKLITYIGNTILLLMLGFSCRQIALTDHTPEECAVPVVNMKLSHV